MCQLTSGSNHGFFVRQFNCGCSHTSVLCCGSNKMLINYYRCTVRMNSLQHHYFFVRSYRWKHELKWFHIISRNVGKLAYFIKLPVTSDNLFALAKFMIILDRTAELLANIVLWWLSMRVTRQLVYEMVIFWMNSNVTLWRFHMHYVHWNFGKLYILFSVICNLIE